MATIKCRGCKREISERAMICPHCGCFVVAGEAAAGLSAGNDGAMRYIVPGSNVSGIAIAAGYLGLLSLAMVPAPFALLTGVLAVRAIKRDENKRGLGRAWFGIIMGALGSAALIFVVVASVNGK